MEKLKKNTGVTLIALIVTIIVLLILASLSISMLTGENGILTQVNRAKIETEKGSEKEQVQLSAVGALAKDNGGEIKRNYLEEELKNNIDGNYQLSEKAPYIVTIEETGRKYIIDANGNITGPVEEPEIVEPTGEGGKMDTMLYGVIEIKWLAGTTDYAVEMPNAPVIKEDLPSGTSMKLVHYDEEGNVKDGTDYNYIAGKGTEDNRESRWANAEVEIDGVKSYFVWIPRYAYKIIYFNSEETKKNYLENGDTSGIIGYSDSRGIVDKDGKKIDGVASEPTIDVGDYYRVHPAFTDDIENGGWSEDLEGIWVGKYISGLINKKDNSNIITSGKEIGNIIVDKTNNTDKAIVIQSGISAWGNCTIGNFYISAKAYLDFEKGNNYIKSHMLKNSEWGAVAYLTESKYGRNGVEVERQGSILNVNQSSTGNETGIYDLSGGSWNCVAVYYNKSNSLSAGNSFASIDGKSDMFSTAYTETELSLAYKPGDATYETKNWHNDDAYFIESSNPFLLRGRHVKGDNIAGGGIFSCGVTIATGVQADRLRMCLAIK